MLEACGILGAVLIAAVADTSVIYTGEPMSLAQQVGGWGVPLLLGYILGSIPFGLILTRVAGLGDIRSIGSGNIGATNVLRTGNKKLAALTLLLDALKGTTAVYLGYQIGAGHGVAIDGQLLAGLGAFVGHIFPIWLGFKGGKGVATYIGVMLGLVWPGALIFCAIWLAVAFLTRYSSLSALVASVATPIGLLLLDEVPAAVVMSLLTVLLLWKHSSNVKRLIAGEEPRIGGKA
jgi:acyl phosphate:glycerol-3-phosphate acyltransferase